MLSLARNGYTAAQVDAALHAGARTLTYRYERRRADNSVIGDTNTVITASIVYDATANIQRTARISLMDDGSIDFLSERLKMYARLRMPDGGYAEFPLGVFLLSTSPRKHRGAFRFSAKPMPHPGALLQADSFAQVDVAGYDLAQVLTDDKVTDRYTVAAAANSVGAVQSLLTSAGLTAQQVTASGLLMPAARDWAPGTSKLQIINDLLASINYNALWFDADGTAIVEPYVSPGVRTVDYTYTADSLSVIAPGFTQGRDLFAVPNRIVVTRTEPDQAVLTSTATNTNAVSPTSTVSRGRTIVQFVAESQPVTDQATLDAIAAKLLFEASQVLETVTFDTAIMPMHANLDVLSINFPELALIASYNEIGWGIDTSLPGALMHHTARRVVSV